MRSLSLQSCRMLMFVLILAPVFVNPKQIQKQDSDWTKGEAKTKAGRFDNAVSKDDAKAQAKTAEMMENRLNDTSDDELGASINDPFAAKPTIAVALVDDSASSGDTRWIWIILAALCTVGAGLTGFGYYWSRTRNAPGW
jgi:hypothetical protein